jgi:cellulose synthase operon protein C
MRRRILPRPRRSTTADELIAQTPAAAWPLTLRGTVAAIGEDYAAARGFYESALQREAAHVPALLGLARIAAAEGESDEAARQLRRVIAIDPAQVNAIFGMAQLAVERGELAEAETWLTSAPPSAPRWQLLGNLYVKQRRFAEAADAYARAFDLAPSGELAVRRYFAAREAGLPNPESPLEQWSREHPADAPAAFSLATLALERGDQDAAIELYEKVLETDSRHAPTLNNLAWLYDQRGDARALDLAIRAREALPGDPSVADTLGWLYVQRKEAARGLPLLEEAVRARPDHPEIRYHYAVALSETGSRPRAVSLLRELLAEPVEFLDRAAARERLEDLETAAP